MKKSTKISRRNFIRKGTLAAAGTTTFLALDWQKALASQANKKTLKHPVSYAGHIEHIPLDILGLTSVPAIPVVVDEVPTTLLLLGARSYEVLQAKNGLNNIFTINGQSATGFAFMYGINPSDQATLDREALLELFQNIDIQTLLQEIFDLIEKADRSSLDLSDDPLTTYFLDDPNEFSLSWTTFYNIYAKAAANVLPQWAATLTDVQAATKQFWPTISRFGLAYNLIIIQKVDNELLGKLKQKFGDLLPDHSRLEQLSAAGGLYAIDLTIFNSVEVNTVEDLPRFTPGTLTLLQQDSTSLELSPISIIVSGPKGAGSQTFIKGVATTGAWLYALQAAKVSITVYGIWLGHVYHFHIVTAAMAMTMYNNLPNTHPLFTLLDKQSQWVIEFDEVLLLLWRSIAPPSSITSGLQLFDLLNTYATGRNYFDDDPLSTLNNQGIKQENFTTDSQHPWNQFPIVGQFLSIWNSTTTYVTTVVNSLYASDSAVANDTALQAWMTEAGDASQGNIQGLPTMNTKQALIDVLTSYIYRITAHSASRLIETANPSLAFVANFPPCLQNATIPKSTATINTQQLLQYLPNTGTIGEMINFLFIFAFSAPYDSFIPATGIGTGFLYSGDASDPKNAALIQFRTEISAFILQYTSNAFLPNYPPDEPQYQQWPLNIET